MYLMAGLKLSGKDYKMSNFRIFVSGRFRYYKTLSDIKKELTSSEIRKIEHFDVLYDSVIVGHLNRERIISKLTADDALITQSVFDQLIE